MINKVSLIESLPFLTLQERKKRRKKLKSRRERNKHKVLLRLTHHKSQSTPQHVQQAAHQVGTGCCHGDNAVDNCREIHNSCVQLSIVPRRLTFFRAPGNEAMFS